jgi:hypothetical protein
MKLLVNPLLAPAATSETIAQLAGMKVVFNFETSTETAFFNGTTAEAMSTNGFLVLLGIGGNRDELLDCVFQSDPMR